MSIRDNLTIPVLNYNNFNVSTSTNIKEYFFEASDGVNPTIQYMSFPELVYVNGITSCFRTGLLMFDESQQEEIYTELKIPNWKDILTNAVIKDIILHPTKEGLEKIINITDNSIFDRIVGIMIGLKNDNADDISMRVVRTIEERALELRRGITKTQIKITFKETPKVNDNELEQVRAKNAELENKILEMQKMMEQLTVNNQIKTDDIPEVATTPKKAGRPPKSK